MSINATLAGSSSNEFSAKNELISKNTSLGVKDFENSTLPGSFNNKLLTMNELIAKKKSLRTKRLENGYLYLALPQGIVRYDLNGGDRWMIERVNGVTGMDYHLE